MAHKKIIFILLIIVLAVGTVIALLLRRDRQRSLLNDGQSKKVVIETERGDVEINDFYSRPSAQRNQFETIIAENNKYSIAGFTENKSFSIIILAEPVGANRQLSENAFLDKLSINKADACKLNVYLQVPYFVNEEYAGPNYGLSFCPGSREFGK